MKLIRKIKYTGVIELRTGLHIGDSKSNLNIGGIDNAVIKDPQGKVYIPGSSLKGKMRCLLELSEGTIARDGGPVDDSSTHAGMLFGISAGTSGRPSRLIVRDCTPLTDSPAIEVKTEVNINRLQGTSLSGPRKMERVAAGTQFGYEMILNIFDTDDEQALKSSLQKAMTLLEQDYLGGSGSRGYGQIVFKEPLEEIIFEAI